MRNGGSLADVAEATQRGRMRQRLGCGDRLTELCVTGKPRVTLLPCFGGWVGDILGGTRHLPMCVSETRDRIWP